jgi:hypothetical protein
VLGEFWPKPLHTEVIEHVPTGQLRRVVEDFKDSGAVEIKAEPDREDTWRVVATFRRSSLDM